MGFRNSLNSEYQWSFNIKIFEENQDEKNIPTFKLFCFDLLLLTFSFSIINIYMMVLAPGDPDTSLKYDSDSDASLLVAGASLRQNCFISNPFTF